MDEIAQTLIAAWRAHRAAVADLNAAIRAEGSRPDLDRFPQNIRWIHLPTWQAVARTEQAYADAVAIYRREHPRPGTEGAGFVAKRGDAYEAKCHAHPRFRRIAWSRASTPARSVRDHNVEHHGGAPVVVIDTPDLVPSTLLP